MFHVFKRNAADESEHQTIIAKVNLPASTRVWGCGIRQRGEKEENFRIQTAEISLNSNKDYKAVFCAFIAEVTSYL